MRTDHLLYLPPPSGIRTAFKQSINKFVILQKESLEVDNKSRGRNATGNEQFDIYQTQNLLNTLENEKWASDLASNLPRSGCKTGDTNLWANCFTPKKLSSWVGLIVERSKWYGVQPWSIRSVVTTKYVLPQRDRKEKSSERKDN